MSACRKAGHPKETLRHSNPASDRSCILGGKGKSFALRVELLGTCWPCFASRFVCFGSTVFFVPFCKVAAPRGERTCVASLLGVLHSRSNLERRRVMFRCVAFRKPRAMPPRICWAGFFLDPEYLYTCFRFFVSHLRFLRFSHLLVTECSAVFSKRRRCSSRFVGARHVRSALVVFYVFRHSRTNLYLSAFLSFQCILQQEGVGGAFTAGFRLAV